MVLMTLIRDNKIQLYDIITQNQFVYNSLQYGKNNFEAITSNIMSVKSTDKFNKYKSA